MLIGVFAHFLTQCVLWLFDVVSVSVWDVESSIFLLLVPTEKNYYYFKCAK